MPEKSVREGAPLVHEQVGTNEVFHGTWDYGDIDRCIRDADRVVKGKLHFHRFSSTPIENNGVVVNYDRANGFLNIYCNNQMPMFCIPWLSFGLRFPSNKIRMITGDIGGGFGAKIISLSVHCTDQSAFHEIQTPGKVDRGSARAYVCEPRK